MSVIDNAIARLQVLALRCTNIKNAPNYPIEDATSLPLAIAHIFSGEGIGSNASTVQLNTTVNVDFHFARVNIKDAYSRIDTLIPEYLQRLGGDPTLNGTVDTIQFPVPYSVNPAQWDTVITQMVSFAVTFKTLETPITT
jgi:hypothetical protein